MDVLVAILINEYLMGREVNILDNEGGHIVERKNGQYKKCA